MSSGTSRRLTITCEGREVEFWNGRYTELNERFDYTSLNPNQVDGVERFTILILDCEPGAEALQR
jgi:hypothetical protein